MIDEFTFKGRTKVTERIDTGPIYGGMDIIGPKEVTLGTLLSTPFWSIILNIKLRFMKTGSQMTKCDMTSCDHLKGGSNSSLMECSTELSKLTKVYGSDWINFGLNEANTLNKCSLAKIDLRNWHGRKRFKRETRIQSWSRLPARKILRLSFK